MKDYSPFYDTLQANYSFAIKQMPKARLLNSCLENTKPVTTTIQLRINQKESSNSSYTNSSKDEETQNTAGMCQKDKSDCDQAL